MLPTCRSVPRRRLTFEVPDPRAPSAAGPPAMRRFGDAATGFCSDGCGCADRRRRGYDRGLVISDTDWPAPHRNLHRITGEEDPAHARLFRRSDALLQREGRPRQAHCKRPTVTKTDAERSASCYEELDTTTRRISRCRDGALFQHGTPRTPLGGTTFCPAAGERFIGQSCCGAG